MLWLWQLSSALYCFGSLFSFVFVLIFLCCKNAISCCYLGLLGVRKIGCSHWVVYFYPNYATVVLLLKSVDSLSHKHGWKGW